MRIIFSVSTILLFLLAGAAYAQPIPPDPPSAAVPITGVEWLLLSGGLFGAHRVYQNYKNRR